MSRCRWREAARRSLPRHGARGRPAGAFTSASALAAPLRRSRPSRSRRKIRDTKKGVVVHGILAYEAQVAGMGDDSRSKRARASSKRWIRWRASTGAIERRPAIVEALKKDGLRLALGERRRHRIRSTRRRSGVTRGRAGSGLFKSHLFDYYRAPYMRRARAARSSRSRAFASLPEIVTCAGAGTSRRAPSAGQGADAVSSRRLKLSPSKAPASADASRHLGHGSHGRARRTRRLSSREGGRIHGAFPPGPSLAERDDRRSCPHVPRRRLVLHVGELLMVSSAAE